MRKLYLLEELQDLARAQNITELDVDKVYIIELSYNLLCDRFNKIARRLHEELEQLGIQALIFQSGAIDSIKQLK